MTIKLLIILAFVPSLLSITNQNNPAGKNFKALLGQSCREMTDGGCMIYTYRILNFKSDSVEVSYQVMAYCSPNERQNNYNHTNDHLIKTYKWSVCKDSLSIHGLDDYGTLIFQNSTLIGEDKSTKRKIVFSEE
jgi:hypothetical protein